MTKLDDISEQSIHTALKRMRDASAAATSPLCALQVIEQRMTLEGYPDTAIWRATALRKELIDLIQLLNPAGDGEPVNSAKSHEDRQSRAYTILYQRYVLGQLAYNIANRLHISARLYHLEQRRAIRQIAQLLLEKELTLRGGRAKVSDPAAKMQPTRPLKSDAQPVDAQYAEVSSHSAGNTPHDRPFLVPNLPVTHIVQGRDELAAQFRLKLSRMEQPKHFAFWGSPGAGKTAFMSYVFHDMTVREAYPDGALYGSLGAQGDSNTVLLAWAVALGLSPNALAETPARDRLQFVKALIGSRRMLIGIDDVWNLNAAHALAVAGPNCVTLLATRSPLIAREFAADNAIQVSELSEPASAALLRSYVRDIDHVAPGAMQTAIRSSGGLPLTLSLIGRDWQRVRSLTSTPSLFGALGSSNRSRTDDILHGIISTSYKAVDRQAQLALVALAALPPKPHAISDEAMNAIAGDWRTVEQLVDVGLVLPQIGATGEVSYTVHKSIRDFVAGLPTPSGLDESEARMIDYFIYQAESKRNQLTNQTLQSLQAAIELARERNDRDRVQRAKMALPGALN